jgi:hypothetical protein
MKTLLLGIIAVLAHAQAPLTNADVVKMASQGISQASMIEAIKSARAVSFQVAPPDQPALEASGVPRPVVMEMMQRVMRDEARSNVRSGSPMDASPKAAPIVRPPQPRRPPNGDWALGAGRPEFSIRVGGSSAFQNRGGGLSSSWLVGAGLGVGIHRYLAAMGEYSYESIQGIILGPVAYATTKIQDVLGGVRIGTAGRVSPYAFIGGGVMHYRAVEERLFLFIEPRHASATNPAFALGGGINVSLRQHVGIQTDFRAVKPSDFVWYARATGGLYFRF